MNKDVITMNVPRAIYAINYLSLCLLTFGLISLQILITWKSQFNLVATLPLACFGIWGILTDQLQNSYQYLLNKASSALSKDPEFNYVMPERWWVQSMTICVSIGFILIAFSVFAD